MFADYQLLAAMGQLLAYLKAPTSVDAEPLQIQPFGIFPMKLPPVLFTLPEPGSEPLNIAAGGVAVRDRGGLRIYAAATPGTPGVAATGVAAAEPQVGSFERRWPETTVSWFESIFGRSPAPAPEQRPAVQEAMEPEPVQATPAAPPLRPGQPLDLGPGTSAFAPTTSSQPAWLSSAKVN